MARSKTHGPDSRILQSEIRRMKKQLKQLQRSKHAFEDKDSDEQETKEFVKKKQDCPNCDEGNLMSIDFGVASYVTCNSCDYRKKVESGKDSKK